MAIIASIVIGLLMKSSMPALIQCSRSDCIDDAVSRDNSGIRRCFFFAFPNDTCGLQSVSVRHVAVHKHQVVVLLRDHINGGESIICQIDFGLSSTTSTLPLNCFLGNVSLLSMTVASVSVLISARDTSWENRVHR